MQLLYWGKKSFTNCQ